MGIRQRWQQGIEPAHRGRAAGYGVALVLGCAALLLRALVAPRFGSEAMLALAVPAVVVSAWFGGFWPGLLATAIVMLGRLAMALAQDTEVLDGLYLLRSAVALPSALLLCAAFEQARRARLRAESRARLAEDESLAVRHLAAALQALPVAVFDMDLELRYVRQLSTSLGVLPTDIIGRRAEDLFDAPTAAHLTRLRREVLASGQPRRTEMEYRGAHGGFWVDLLMTPLHDDAGRTVGIINVAIDINEKRQREQAERRAKERLQRLVDSAAVAIAFSQGGRITEANDAFLVLLGYGRQDLEAGRIHEGLLVPESERAVYAMAQQELAETGSNGPYRATLQRPDGILVEVITSAGRLGEDDCCLFLTDITALSRAEAALRISEERFRSLVNATAAIVWTAGPQRDFVAEQPSWAAYTGQVRAQYQGLGWLEALHPDDRARARRAWEQASGEQAPFGGRARLWHQASGNYRRVMARAHPVRRDGRIVQWVGMVFDVEEGERVSERLQEASERLQLLVENAPVAVIEFDGALRITRWAAQAQAIFGWTAEEAVGRRAAELGWALPEDTVGPMQLRELVRGQIPRARFRIRNRARDGRVLHAEWSLSAVRREGRLRPTALLALVLDVSEREQAVEALQQADRQKDNFIATLAHELRNPLAPIANGARLLGMKPDDPKTVTWAAQAIERQVKQLARLLDDLLDVSRISRNVLQLQRHRLRLQDALELAVEQVRPFLEAQGHRLQVQIAQAPMLLMGDVARLTQVFANLLHNAAKYTPQPGLIELRAAPHGALLVVSVQDPGLGIPPAEQQRVFEMFSQAHPELRSAQPGLGIGLALVKGIVDIHGGGVRVDSEGAGRGSRFTVSLPALQAAEEGAAATSGAGPGSISGLRILVVDDNVDSAQSIAAVLAQTGNTVRTAFHAQAALALGAEFHPAVVLMDIGMPGMDGLQAARLMRETEWGRAAVLAAMTGYGQPEDRRRALQAGFDHHFTKPVDFDRLARCLAG